MRVIIIEDEPLAAERLKLLLSELDPSIRIEAVLGTVEESVRFLSSKPAPDLIFLDIELSDGISFHIFSKVSVPCPVILTTAYDRYAIEAFRLFSIDYILKPVSSSHLAEAIGKYHSRARQHNMGREFLQAIETFREKILRPYKSRFLVKTGSRLLFIETNRAAYFFATGKNVYLVTEDGNRYPIDYTLEKLQELLEPRSFFRLNRSVICSIRSISEIKTHLNSRLKIGLRAGRQVSEAIVSRERVNAFKAWAEA